jgi:hypothetical protein
VSWKIDKLLVMYKDTTENWKNAHSPALSGRHLSPEPLSITTVPFVHSRGVSGNAWLGEKAAFRVRLAGLNQALEHHLLSGVVAANKS